MEVTPAHLDVLTEIANVGMSRAATQLSILLNDVIEVKVPEVVVSDTEHLGELVDLAPDQDVASVWQDLSGYIDGRAVLVFHSDESRALVNALIGSVPTLTGLDMRNYEHEAMIEIGNIIVSSAIAVMADMLDGEIRMSVPFYAEEPMHALVARQIASAHGGERRVLVIRARMRAAQRNVTGTLVVLMGVNSMSELLNKVDQFLYRTGACR